MYVSFVALSSQDFLLYIFEILIPSLRLGYANKFILQNSPTDALPQTPKI